MEQAVQQGLVTEGKGLHTLLSAVQESYQAARPTDLASAMQALEKAVESVGRELPYNPEAYEQVLQGYQEFISVGGEVTRVTSTGEIIVTRGTDVLLHLSSH